MTNNEIVSLMRIRRNLLKAVAKDMGLLADKPQEIQVDILAAESMNYEADRELLQRFGGAL